VVGLLLLTVTAFSARDLLRAQRAQSAEDVYLGRIFRFSDDAFRLQVRFYEMRVAGEQPDLAFVRQLVMLSGEAHTLVEMEQRIGDRGPAAEEARRVRAAVDELAAAGREYLVTTDPGAREAVIQRTLLGPVRVVTVHIERWKGAVQVRTRAGYEAQGGRVRAMVVRIGVLIVLLVLTGMVGYVMLGRARVELVRHLTAVAAEQAALRRVATAAAEEGEPEGMLEVLAAEVVALLDADAGWVYRCDRNRAQLVGVCLPERLDVLAAPLAEAEIRAESVVGRAMRAGEPIRLALQADDLTAQDAALAAAGLRTAVAAPVLVEGRAWGVLVAACADGQRLPEGVEERLSPFARLAGVAVANAEVRAQLAERASTDPLTRLPNHGAFQERLTEEVARAQAEDTPLGLVLLDIDHFKAVNDGFGHQVGDRVLAEVAGRLRVMCRQGEMLARVGGEEFAWILPGTDGDGAAAAADRARSAIGASPLPEVGVITVSAGISDLRRAPTASELFRSADAALLFAKANGRDMAVPYERALLGEDGRSAPRRQMSRVRTFDALQALARAVDARDHATQMHSERVADVTHRVALELGWEADRARLLREAAFVHDVGKIGVPDAVLRKPGRLTDAEFAQIKVHSELGAQIVSEVMTAEQVAWVRHHHERMDGRGYPDGLRGESIPEGARILAAADSWDAMTADRPYRAALSPEETMAEFRAVSGTQLDPLVVAVMERLFAAGSLNVAGGAGEAPPARDAEAPAPA